MMLFKIQFLAMLWGTYGYQLIPRMEECGLVCSQGFLCKTQTFTGIFNSFCHRAPISFPTSSPPILRSMKLWTAMKCTEGGPCSLYLSVKGTLQFEENISGIEICSLSMDTQNSQCVNVKISRNMHIMRKVKVQFNCFEVSAGQHVHVTMRTIPNYCGVNLSQEYYVEDCRNGDVEENIPDCFAGRMTYDVNRARKTILVNISDVDQDTDYYIRLCHQWFVCEDVEPVTLVPRKDLMKAISLPYTNLLPCLCIEAWPAVSDARRMQLCPFKNDTQALWDSIIYNSFTQTLAWEASCPVHVTVSLCQRLETWGPCVDLQNTSHTAVEKVKYSRVDAHPGLCMKFKTKHGSSVRCPFAYSNSQAWNMRLDVIEEQLQISFTSPTKAQFSVCVHNNTESSSCDSAGIHQSLSMDGSNTTSVNISAKTCGSNVCIQGWRADVDYSVSMHICDMPCISSIRSQEHHESSLNMISVVALLAIVIIMVTLLGHQLLSGFHRKKFENTKAASKRSQRVKRICYLH